MADIAPYILIVEDDEAHAELINRILRMNDFSHRLVFSRCLKEAQAEIENEAPLLVLTDLRLPDGQGTRLIVPVESKTSYPIIIMTSHGNEESAVEAMRAGAVDYIVKGPQTFTMLHRTIERALREWTLLFERSRAENALARSEERYRNITETLTDYIYTLDIADDHITGIHHGAACRAVTGYSREELSNIRRQWLKLVHPDDRKALLDMVRKVLTRQSPDIMEHRIIHKNGSTRWVKNAIVAHRDKRGRLLACDGVVSDITERKIAENKQRQLAEALGQSAEAIVITDDKGKIEYANQSFSRMTMYCREDIVGKNTRILKSGLQTQVFYQELWETLLSGRTWTGQFTNRRKDGTLYKAETTITPIVDQSSASTKYIAVSRDVTRESQMETQLRQAQKLHAIGTLAGGIAHDFNNILYAVLGYTELAQQKTPNESPAQDYLKEVLTAGNRAVQLIGQILAFSRQNDQERVPGKLQPILKEALKLLRGTIPTTIKIENQIFSNCGPVLADPTQIHQVLMNLCTNAYHAMRESGGVLTVRYEEVELSEADAAQHVDLDPGAYAVLTVSDSGHGMDQETLERAFDPFFTTKATGEGTGMGLSTVHGIVKSHKGSIDIASSPGAGTQICIYLPICEDRSPDNQTPRSAELEAGEGRLMFVDDEKNIVAMASKMLESYGYSVETFTNPEHALEAVEENPEKWDAVITDQTMPGITGLELARAAFSIRGDLPIVLCTGYSEHVNEEIAQEAGIHEYLHKPILSKDLVLAIARARIKCLDQRLQSQTNAGA